MTAERVAVTVTIGGEDFTVRSEVPPEYTREIAEYFDAIFRGVKAAAPRAEVHKVAILAGLAVTDELFQGRRGDTESAEKIKSLAQELTRLIPSGKRSPTNGPNSEG